MTIRPDILQAIGGSGLSAGDYAGMTPEQIAMVAGQGQKDRQVMLGTVMDMSQHELAIRKQEQEELQQERMFQMMQRQEARAEFQTMHRAMFDHLEHGLRKRQLALQSAQVGSSLATDAMQREKLGLQLNELKRQQETIATMRDKSLEVPGYTDDKGNPLKMTIGELSAIGALDKVLETGLRKSLGSTTGGSKVVELREYMARTAKEMGASKQVVDRIKLMGPEAVKGMNRQTIYNAYMKNDPLFSMMDEAEKQRLVETDLGIIDMLRIDVAGKVADDNLENLNVGADVPGGQPPKAKSLEDYFKEEGF